MKIESRLMRVERWASMHRVEPMVAVVELADGSQAEMAVADMLDADGGFRSDIQFKRFVSGRSLTDLETFLSAHRITAERPQDEPYYLDQPCPRNANRPCVLTCPLKEICEGRREK